MKSTDHLESDKDTRHLTLKASVRLTKHFVQQNLGMEFIELRRTPYLLRKG